MNRGRDDDECSFPFRCPLMGRGEKSGPCSNSLNCADGKDESGITDMKIRESCAWDQ